MDGYIYYTAEYKEYNDLLTGDSSSGAKNLQENIKNLLEQLKYIVNSLSEWQGAADSSFEGKKLI